MISDVMCETRMIKVKRVFSQPSYRNHIKQGRCEYPTREMEGVSQAFPKKEWRQNEVGIVYVGIPQELNDVENTKFLPLGLSLSSDFVEPSKIRCIT